MRMSFFFLSSEKDILLPQKGWYDENFGERIHCWNREVLVAGNPVSRRDRNRIYLSVIVQNQMVDEVLYV